MATLTADRVFAGCARSSGQGFSHQVANFTEFWHTARAATSWLEGRGAASDGGDGARSAAKGGGGIRANWLVVSDAPLLKQRACAEWPWVAATSVVPTQVGSCGAPSDGGRRTSLLHTVAELLLLSESDVLVLGRSRFPMAALLLSRSCKQALFLFLDRRCRRKNARRMPTLDLGARNRKALRCVGTEFAYSARRLQDPRGRLLHDGTLDMF